MPFLLFCITKKKISSNNEQHLIFHRGNDVSTFFVLGKQPFGQFPPGWDVGLEVRIIYTTLAIIKI
jgi:hypothetical protein